MPIRTVPVTERLVEGPAQRDGAVFGGVVIVHFEVSAGAEGEVETRVPRKGRQHVIQEPETGVDLGCPPSVEVENHLDVGLTGLPVQLSSAWHREPPRSR